MNVIKWRDTEHFEFALAIHIKRKGLRKGLEL